MSDIVDNWKVIFSSGVVMEVHSAKNYLESEGVETLLQNELAAQIYANNADKAKILVKERDFEKATEILNKGGYL